jgi:HAD superfamily hydrolase (TIGR01490 family)
MPDFIQHAVGRAAYWSGLLRLSPMLSAYAFKIIPNNIAKEQLISNFFAGWNAEHFQEIADQYALSRIDSIVRLEAVERMRQHQAQGDKVVVVSASMENWLKKWCEQHCLDLIATQLEVRDGRLTGKFATKNCYGMEKVNRIKEQYDLALYNVIYAYGDSRGDKEMLEIATVRHYREFK